MTWTTAFGLENAALARAEPVFARAFRAIFTMTLNQVAKRSIVAARKRS